VNLSENPELSGRDFGTGIEFGKLVENQPLLGHFDGEQVILIRQGAEVFATGASCTHYHGPLAEGLVVGATVRCPWHHARFNIRTGEAEGAPALDPVPSFNVSRRGDIITVDGKKAVASQVACPLKPPSIVIVGAGASGAACADMLRAKGYVGPITMAGDEEPGPVDRPNLSKDFLAGTAPEEWLPLRTPEYYKSIEVELAQDPAVQIQPAERQVVLQSGRKLSYGSLLIATGAAPRSLSIEGANLPHVHTLRTLTDCKAIIARAAGSKTCAVIGSGFIGLEVAASLRARGLELSVIGQEAVPLAKVLGPELGRFIQGVHERHGVRFFLNSKTRAIRKDHVELADGQSVTADMVIVGVGVEPRTSLARAAGLQVDNGIVVGDKLQTSAQDIFAAGDVARYVDFVSGEPARIEHWVVAERQGQAVARSMLGLDGQFHQTPFFWSQHHDVTISYTGHAATWDNCEIKGNLEKNDACAVYRSKGKVLAIATINRDLLGLRVEAAMEQGDFAAVDSILQNQ
jgi:NADPH-dependent 2,4-dienoyl-CoA reductase/sulfur reductase-like enzyme/nitrite reductase/ring-hydroxylating ferredoxin subunit